MSGYIFPDELPLQLKINGQLETLELITTLTNYQNCRTVSTWLWSNIHKVTPSSKYLSNDRKWIKIPMSFIFNYGGGWNWIKL